MTRYSTNRIKTDVFDKVLEADLKHKAVMTAAFVWLEANRDALLPLQ